MRNNRKTDTIIYSILLCTSMKTSIRNIYICVSKKKKKKSIVLRLFTSVKLDAVLDDGVMMVGCFVVVVVVVFFSFFLAKRW